MDACNLAAKDCIPCRGAAPPLPAPEAAALHAQLGSGWRLIEGHHLEKEFPFRNFRDALAFTNRVGDLAEQQKHHPDIHLAWGLVTILIWTHKIYGLTESDFILAAKIDTLP
jgi:4a-hydroxytetrahydrobiopterin dehydratase